MASKPCAPETGSGRPSRTAPLLAVLWSMVVTSFFASMGVKNEENLETSTDPVARARKADDVSGADNFLSTE